MTYSNEIDVILEKTVREFENLFKDSLKSVILYGSYARGDFDDESDIDIVALVDVERAMIGSYFNAIAKFSSQIDLEHGVMLSPTVVPYEEFSNFGDDLPYYANIKREGVILNAQ